MDDPPKLAACKVQIPLVMNDGKEVAPEVLVEILSSFDRQFGGYTILGQMEGSWHGQVEPSIRVEVAVPENRIGQFRQLVHAIGVRLHQQAMYLDAPPPSVEIIPMENYVTPGGQEGASKKKNGRSIEGGAG